MVNLDIPYFSQLDNVNNPYGSCNVTSYAMALRFLGVKGDGSGQLEDQFYTYLARNGLDRHVPEDLAEIAKTKGVKVKVTRKGSWKDVRDCLDDGKPVVIHGYFTTGGHIVVIRGYDCDGFFINDPYGELMYDSRNPSGRYYDRTVSGENLHYSNKLMTDLCGSDGDLWLHLFDPKMCG